MNIDQNFERHRGSKIVPMDSATLKEWRREAHHGLLANHERLVKRCHENGIISLNVRGELLKDFFIFESLPLEIQDMIFKFCCCLLSQSIRTRIFDFRDGNGAEVDFVDHPNPKVPALFQVNRRSRAIARKKFTLTSNPHEFQIHNPGCFYTNFECDSYYLSFWANAEGRKCWPTFRYSDQFLYEQLNRRGNEDNRSLRPYVNPPSFPTTLLAPDIFSKIRHLQIDLDLEPNLVPLIHLDMFQDWVDHSVANFLATFGPRTIQCFPALKSLDFVMHHQHYDPEAETELKEIDRVMVKDVQDRNAFPDGAFGRPELRMIENALWAQFWDLYQGNEGPKWDVRIQLAIPKTKVQTAEVLRKSIDILDDEEFFADSTESDFDFGTDSEEV